MRFVLVAFPVLKRSRIHVAGLAACMLMIPRTLWSEERLQETDQATKALIVSLEESESLYRNLDVQWHEEYEFLLARRTPGLLLKEQADGHSVRQNGMLFLNYEGKKSNAESPIGDVTPVHDRVGYDGDTTRLLDHRGSYIANIKNEPVYNWRMFDPHAFPLRHAHKKVPLSTWLRGKEAYTNHPFGDASNFRGGRELAARYDGEDVVDGLNCARVALFSLRPNPDGTMRVSGRRIFWLAKDRNLLPVKALTYNHYYSHDLPIELAVLTDFRELAPGVWFPYGGQITVYDEIALREQLRAEVSSRRDFTILNASLNPRHDVEFFRNVDFPEGTPVYKVVDGKIVESYRAGSPQ